MVDRVTAVIDGREYVATERYHSLQHSGDAQEFRRFTPDWALGALHRAGYNAPDIEGGTVTVVGDDEVWSVGMGVDGWPERTTGTTSGGGLGLGYAGRHASLDILNYGKKARKRFEVEYLGSGDRGQQWRTTVDGEVVTEGATRPFQVLWGDADSGGSWL